MLIKILPVQIPVFWESIKFCAVTADEVGEKYRQKYLNKLLHSLLSNRSQCFVRLNEQRVLQALMITSLDVDNMTDKKALCIQLLYSIERVAEGEWREDYDFLLNFAKKQQCQVITFGTRHERVMSIGQAVGFREVQRSFEFNLE